MIWYSQINYLFLNYKNYLVDKLQKALIFLDLVEHNECQASHILSRVPCKFSLTPKISLELIYVKCYKYFLELLLT